MERRRQGFYPAYAGWSAVNDVREEAVGRERGRKRERRTGERRVRKIGREERGEEHRQREGGKERGSDALALALASLTTLQRYVSVKPTFKPSLSLSFACACLCKVETKDLPHL